MYIDNANKKINLFNNELTSENFLVFFRLLEDNKNRSSSITSSKLLQQPDVKTASKMHGHQSLNSDIATSVKHIRWAVHQMPSTRDHND